MGAVMDRAVFRSRFQNTLFRYFRRCFAHSPLTVRFPCFLCAMGKIGRRERRPNYLNAANPVTSMPVMSRWMSCVPS